MQKVSGIGGVFFKSKDPRTLQKWYAEHLGVEPEWGADSDGGSGRSFRWKSADPPHAPGTTVWSLFPRDTKYFTPGNAGFMINYRVDDLDEMLAQLRSAGVEVDEKIEESEFGRFGWAVDPEGNRIELWEPPEGM